MNSSLKNVRVIDQKTSLIKNSNKSIQQSDKQDFKSDSLHLSTRRKRRNSIFSLNNVNKQKTEESSIEDFESNYSFNDKEFTKKDLELEWKNLIKKFQETGENSISSILNSNSLVLSNKNQIEFTVSNSLMKKQMIANKNIILNHLRLNLKNKDIQLKIYIDEKIDKKFVYTPEEKYEKLKDICPDIEILKKVFMLYF